MYDATVASEVAHKIVTAFVVFRVCSLLFCFCARVNNANFEEHCLIQPSMVLEYQSKDATSRASCLASLLESLRRFREAQTCSEQVS